MNIPGQRLFAGGGLLGRCCRRRAAGTPRDALFALLRQLLLALQILVEPHGLILDDRVLHAQPAFQLMHQFAVISIFPPFSAQVCSIVVSTFLISSSGVTGRMMKIRSYKRSSMMTSFSFFSSSPDRKTGHFSSAGGTRRLNLFMDVAMPCVNSNSTASPASATISAATSRSAFFIGRKTYAARSLTG